MTGALCLTLYLLLSLGLRLLLLLPGYAIRRWRCTREFRKELKRSGMPRALVVHLTERYRDQMRIGEMLRWARALKRDFRG